MSRCKLSLGNDRYVEVKEWKGELRVDLREWKDHKPTKKGISLTLMRWKNWVTYLEYMDQAIAEKKHYKSHLGGNVYCTVNEGSACMDIRQYWKPQEEVVPTKKGVVLETHRIQHPERTLAWYWKCLTRIECSCALLHTKRSHEPVRGHYSAQNVTQMTMATGEHD